MLKYEISIHHLFVASSFIGSLLCQIWSPFLQIIGLVLTKPLFYEINNWIFLTLYITIFQLLFLVFLILDLIVSKKWDILAVGPTSVFAFLHALQVLADHLYNKIYFNEICLKGLLYLSWIISLLSCNLF